MPLFCLLFSFVPGFALGFPFLLPPLLSKIPRSCTVVNAELVRWPAMRERGAGFLYVCFVSVSLLFLLAVVLLVIVGWNLY